MALAKEPFFVHIIYILNSHMSVKVKIHAEGF